MSDKKKIVIIGNGFGGIYTLKNLHKYFHKDKNIELSLIGEKNYFLFTPLLHEVATGSINGENITEPIRKIFGCCLNNFYLDKAIKINTKDKTIQTEKYIISYDYLVIAPGSQTNFFNIPGAEQYSLTLKSIEDAVKIKNQTISKIEYATHIEDRDLRKKALSFVIIGGGPTGVELAAELHELIKENFSDFYKKEFIDEVSINIIQKNSELLPQFSKKVREKSLKVLQNKGINVILNASVTEISKSYVMIDSTRKLEAETIIWVAGIKPTNIDFDQEIPKSKDGKLLINQYLQLKNYKEIFALGDNALIQNNEVDVPLPALAQVAEKESKILAENIYLLLNNKELKPFVYKHSGSLISLGRFMAIGEISNFIFSGHITWWLWRTIYLSKLISFRKKIKVALDWTINLFSRRDISQL